MGKRGRRRRRRHDTVGTVIALEVLAECTLGANGFLIASPESGRHLNPAGRRELTPQEDFKPLKWSSG